MPRAGTESRHHRQLLARLARGPAPPDERRGIRPGPRYRDRRDPRRVDDESLILVILSRFLAAQFARPSGWLGRHAIGPWLDRISGPMNELALAELGVRETDDVLEVGFGGGALLAMIVECTEGQVTGIDV